MLLYTSLLTLLMAFNSILSLGILTFFLFATTICTNENIPEELPNYICWRELGQIYGPNFDLKKVAVSGLTEPNVSFKKLVANT